MNNTEQAIIKTLAYYQALGQYPLTSIEIYRYLQKENDGHPIPSFYSLFKQLRESPELNQRLASQNGFFFLKGNVLFFSQRIGRQKIAIAKWRKVRRIAKFLSLSPFLRGLLVSGSLALSNTKKGSDLDFLVITKENRIWTGRTFLSLLLQLIGQRRHDKVVADKICLNHYLSQAYLTVSLQNLSNAQLYSHLSPLTDYSNYRLFQKQNKWIANFLFFYPPNKQNHQRRLNEKSPLFTAGRLAARTVEILLNGALGNWLEKILSRWQTNRIRQKTSFRQLKEEELLLSDKALLFHYPICKNNEVMEIYSQIIKNYASR
jgi:hypothetical protein